MHHAWIDGEPAELPAAAATAARLLDASRQPLIAGLGADVAGARAATALAQRIGAAIDGERHRADIAVGVLGGDAEQEADDLLRAPDRVERRGLCGRRRR